MEYNSIFTGEQIDNGLNKVGVVLKNYFEPTSKFESLYKTSGDIVENIYSKAALQYIDENVKEGDIFLVYGYGADSYRLWAFVDASGNILSKSGSDKDARKGVIAVAPANTVKAIFSTYTDYGETFVVQKNDWAITELLKMESSFNDRMLNQQGKIDILFKDYFEPTSKTNGQYKTSGDVAESTYYNGVYQYIDDVAKEGDVYLVYGYGAVGYRLWAFVDASGNILSKSAEEKDARDGVVVIAPANTVKAIFSTHTDYGETFVVQKNHKNLVELLQRLESEIKPVKEKADYLIPEMFTKEDFSKSAKYDTSGDILVEKYSAAYQYVDDTAKEGDTYIVYGFGPTTARLWAFVDANGNILRKADAYYDKTKTPDYIEAPANTTKAIFSSYTDDSHKLLVVKNGVYDKMIYGKERPGSGEGSEYISVLNGKKIVWCGDSIISAIRVLPEQRIPQLIDAITGSQSENKAADGSLFYDETWYTGQARSILWQVKQAAANSDYIIVQGGVNGVNATDSTAQNYAPYGEITDSYTSDFDTKTQIGCLEEICRYLVKEYTGKKIGFIITYQIGGDYKEYLSYWKEKIDKFLPVLEKWGIPYLDWRESGINLAANASGYGIDSFEAYEEFDSTKSYNVDESVIYNGKLYKANENITPGAFNASKWTLTSSTRYDNWHCNALAYQLLAHKTAKWLETL